MFFNIFIIALLFSRSYPVPLDIGMNSSKLHATFNIKVTDFGSAIRRIFGETKIEY